MADFTLPTRNTASPFANMRGHHVAIRVPDFEVARDWYVEKLDFRVVHEWPFADERLAYLAPANDDHFMVEILGGGDPLPMMRPLMPISPTAFAIRAIIISASTWPTSKRLLRNCVAVA